MTDPRIPRTHVKTPAQVAKEQGVSISWVLREVRRLRDAPGVWVLRHYDGTDDLVAEIKFPDATQAEMETAFGIKLTKFGSTEWLVLGGHCYFIDFDAS